MEPGEAHIWLASPGVVEEPAVADRCRAWLDAEERAACDRFYFERDRNTYLTAHALVRTVLSRYAPVAPEAWRFERNQYGRPAIAGGGSLQFNLSHTRGMVACLVVHDVEAGVDVEHRRNVSLNVADRFFSPAEVSDLRALPESEQRHRFYELWTLKEAYIKARGMGLALSLSGFSYRLGHGEPALMVTLELNDDGAEWQCGLAEPSPEHQLAWAIRAKGRRFDVRILTEDLLSS